MKRIQLFEFEDLPSFPGWIRQCMTAYIQTLHHTFGTAPLIAPLVRRGLSHANNCVIDLCSGAGGPMIDVVNSLRSETENSTCSLVLTDLYPHQDAAESLQSRNGDWLRYERRPVNAAQVPPDLKGMRTMICSFHHMPPDVARQILQDAGEQRQPFLAFEISDNSSPLLLWWTAIPIGFLLSLVMTLRVRPLTFKQLFFTYVVPIVPLFLAWDGAVSNARTYTESDLAELLSQFDSQDYAWEIGKTKPPGLPMPMLYILGIPKASRYSPRDGERDQG